jgi:hypothetical protein
MALEKDDIIELQSILDDRYVKQKDCDERQERVNNRFANDDKRIELLSSKFKIWDKLFWVIASASIGSLVTAIIELISK